MIFSFVVLRPVSDAGHLIDSTTGCTRDYIPRISRDVIVDDYTLPGQNYSYAIKYVAQVAVPRDTRMW